MVPFDDEDKVDEVFQHGASKQDIYKEVRNTWNMEKSLQLQADDDDAMFEARLMV